VDSTYASLPRPLRGNAPTPKEAPPVSDMGLPAFNLRTVSDSRQCPSIVYSLPIHCPYTAYLLIGTQRVAPSLYVGVPPVRGRQWRARWMQDDGVMSMMCMTSIITCLRTVVASLLDSRRLCRNGHSTTSSYGTIILAPRSPSNPCSSTTLQWRLTSRSWLSPSILNPRSSLQSSLLTRRHPVLWTCSMSGNSGLNPFRPHSSLTLAGSSV
jgi:hypothetical protein